MHKGPRSRRSRPFCIQLLRRLGRGSGFHQFALLTRRGVAVNQAFAGRAVEHADGIRLVFSLCRSRLGALDGQTKSGTLRFVARRRYT